MISLKNNRTDKTHRYREQMGCCQRGKGLRVDEMGEGDQEVQTSSY